MFETIRISERGKRGLISLKRKTGITQWNVLCRWSLCLSLSGKKLPLNDITQVSNVEMTWKTFTGSNEQIIEALVLASKANDQDSRSLSVDDYILAHIENGIGILSSSIGNNGVSQLLRLAP